MTNFTQRARAAIYLLLMLLAVTLTMTGWYARGLAKRGAAPTAPFSQTSYRACSEKLGDGKPLCAVYRAPHGG
jgi:hypothetical protein